MVTDIRTLIAATPPHGVSALNQSLRQYYAGQAMAATIMAHSDLRTLPNADAVAANAVEYADALIAELEKPNDTVRECCADQA